MKQVFHYGPAGEHIMYDFVSEELLLSNTSTRPLHDLALCTEAVRVGQMLYCIKQCRAVPYELKTDSYLFRPQKNEKWSSRHCAFVSSTCSATGTSQRSGCGDSTTGAT